MNRVFAALIKGDSILMVQHQHDGRSYWTLPGGGVEAGETPEEAVVREVQEETGLNVSVIQSLFQKERSQSPGEWEKCYLVQQIGEDPAILGYDPELPAGEQMLTDVRWHLLDDVREDIQVSQVLAVLRGADETDD